MSDRADPASAPRRGHRRRGDAADDFRLMADSSPVMIRPSGTTLAQPSLAPAAPSARNVASPAFGIVGSASCATASSGCASAESVDTA